MGTPEEARMAKALENIANSMKGMQKSFEALNVNFFKAFEFLKAEVAKAEAFDQLLVADMDSPNQLSFDEIRNQHEKERRERDKRAKHEESLRGLKTKLETPVEETPTCECSPNYCCCSDEDREFSKKLNEGTDVSEQ